MYQGKHGNNHRGRAPRRPRMSRTVMVALALVLVLGLAIGGTVAYLFTNTDSITNTFTPGGTTPGIEETIDGNAKTSIKITNTGNIDAYIRVMLVGNTVDDEGNITGGFTPEFTYDSTNWTKIGDYYYYNTSVAANNGETSNLLGSSTIAVSANQTVTVLAQSIQAEPNYVVQQTWGVTIANGTVTAYTEGGAA